MLSSTDLWTHCLEFCAQQFDTRVKNLNPPQPDSQDLEPSSIIYQLEILNKFFSLTCLSFPICKQGIIILVYCMGLSWGVNSFIIYVMDLQWCITHRKYHVSCVVLFTIYGQIRLVCVVSNQTHDLVIMSSWHIANMQNTKWQKKISKYKSGWGKCLLQRLPNWPYAGKKDYPGSII